MSERKEGWYWVHDGEEWVPLEYKGGEWWDSGCTTRLWLGDGSGATIGPRIPTPDEEWQCVPKEPDGAMQVAGLKVRVEEDGTAAVYRAMLSAAPQPGGEHE